MRYSILICFLIFSTLLISCDADKKDSSHEKKTSSTITIKVDKEINKLSLLPSKSEDIEKWTKKWKATFPVSATLIRGSKSEWAGTSRSTYRKWDFKAGIANNSGYEMRFGDTLFLIEKVSEDSQYEGVFEVRGAGKGKGGIAIRTFLNNYMLKNADGSYQRKTGSLVQWTFKEEGHNPPESWMTFGTVKSGNNISFESELLMGTMIKTEYLAEVRIILPTLIVKNDENVAKFKYILKFRRAPNSKSDPESDIEKWDMTGGTLVPLISEEVSKIALNDKAELVDRIFSMNWLLEIKAQDTGDIALQLISEKEPKSVRIIAMYALGMAADTRGVYPLLRILGGIHATPGMRRIAADSLGDIGGPEAIPGLVKAVNSKINKLPQDAITALGKCGDHTAVQPLLKVLKDDCRSDLHQKAANALVRLQAKSAIDPLLKLAKDDKAGGQIVAIKALGDLGDESLVPDIAAQFKAKSGDVRKAVCEALGKIGGQAAVKSLKYALEDKNEDVRNTALAGLEFLPTDQIISLLSPKFKHPNKEIAVWAITVSGEKKYGSAVRPLLDLLNDKNVDIRKAAASALGYFEDETAINALISLLHDKNQKVRLAAVSALDEIKSPLAVDSLIDMLKDNHSKIRQATLKALGNLDNMKAFDPVAKLLSSEKNLYAALSTLKLLDEQKSLSLLLSLLPNSNTEMKKWVIDNIGKYKNKGSAIPSLIDMIKDKDSEIRRLAILALSDTHDKSIVQQLITALDDKSSTIRISALEALAESGDGKAVQPVIARLADKGKAENAIEVRVKALETLKKLAPAQVIPSLKALLSTEDTDLHKWAIIQIGNEKNNDAKNELSKLLNNSSKIDRFTVLTVLAEMEDKSAVAPLIEYLRDPDSEIRKTAALYLGKIGDESAVDPLVTAVADKNSAVRCNALEALFNLEGKIDIQAIIERLSDRGKASENDPVRVQDYAFELLKKKEPLKIVPSLITLLSNPDKKVQAWAIEKLGKEKDWTAVDPLIKMIDKKDVNQRIDVIVALGEIGGESSFEPLVKQLSDPNTDVRIAAIQILGKLRDTRSVEPLIRMLNSQNRYIRYEIIEALNKLDGSNFKAMLFKLLRSNNKKIRKLVIDSIKEG